MYNKSQQSTCCGITTVFTSITPLMIHTCMFYCSGCCGSGEDILPGLRICGCGGGVCNYIQSTW